MKETTRRFWLILGKGIPILVLIPLSVLCFNSWWQFIAPVSYYSSRSITVCFPPSRSTVFLEAMLITVLTAVVLTALWSKRWGYLLIKWILLIAVAYSLYAFCGQFSKYWNYITTIKPSQVQTDGRWPKIFKPLLIHLGVAGVLILGLWLWTREQLKGQFTQKSN